MRDKPPFFVLLLFILAYGLALVFYVCWLAPFFA